MSQEGESPVTDGGSVYRLIHKNFYREKASLSRFSQKPFVQPTATAMAFRFSAKARPLPIKPFSLFPRTNAIFIMWLAFPLLNYNSSD